MLTLPAALFKCNIVSENYISDRGWRRNLKSIDSCHFFEDTKDEIRSQVRSHVIPSLGRCWIGQIQCVPPHMLLLFTLVYLFCL